VLLLASEYERLLECARGGLPNEVCGLLAGDALGAVKTIRRVYPLSNRDASPEHFSIDPREHLSAIREMRADGFKPLGNFHSHPNTPARPSREDIRLARDPRAVYLILSLAGAVTLKAFHIENETAAEETLEIV
jgi:proteasome lid subunit RPN8/RPN11